MEIIEERRKYGDYIVKHRKYDNGDVDTTIYKEKEDYNSIVARKVTEDISPLNTWVAAINWACEYIEAQDREDEARNKLASALRRLADGVEKDEATVNKILEAMEKLASCIF